ncbi:MAG TPA: hypothetical protein VK485_05410 [Sphingomicrobium sp.]|nr:hypothetical protein [Sphingomicrobium sp.]
MARSVVRAAQWIITAPFVIDLLAIGYLDDLYSHHHPKRPIGAFIVEHPRHGTSTFITAEESRLYILTWVLPFVLLGIYGILDLWKRSDPQAEDEAE